jgi:predicted TIM-barrel fold metal-dependent hydrolase
MPYVEGRGTVHDADSHIMEGPTWLLDHADEATAEKLRATGRAFQPALSPDEDRHGWQEANRLHADPAYRAEAADKIMGRKNWAAHGSFLAEDRPAALDALGVASQLVFNTFNMGHLQRAEHSGDVDLALGMARAHNRAMVEFCSVDERLLGVGYVPLVDIEAAPVIAREAIDAGCKALLVASACPPGHSPTHIGLDRFWRLAEEAGVPVCYHVGGGGVPMDPSYFENGLPPVPDFHGGDGNFRSLDYLSIQYPVMQALSALVIDGVLLRHPDLRIGVIEMGASWLPGLMKSLDSAHEAFRKNEERLQAMDLKPSEYVRRQVRVTPYPHEDAGWIAELAGPEVSLFSSDWPHVEGGRNPLGRFDRSLERCSDEVRQRFYCDNFVDLVGPSALAGIAA